MVAHLGDHAQVHSRHRGALHHVVVAGVRVFGGELVAVKLHIHFIGRALIQLGVDHRIAVGLLEGVVLLQPVPGAFVVVLKAAPPFHPVGIHVVLLEHRAAHRAAITAIGGVATGSAVLPLADVFALLEPKRLRAPEAVLLAGHDSIPAALGTKDRAVSHRRGALARRPPHLAFGHIQGPPLGLASHLGNRRQDLGHLLPAHHITSSGR